MARKTINQDLVRERGNASFNVSELTHLLDGDVEKTKRRKVLEKEYYEDPELMDKIPIDYLSHTEVYSEALRKSVHMFYKSMDLADPQEILTIADAIMHEASPLTVHFVMFIPALMGMANEDQQAKWLGPALEMKVIGSYAQTELGHGTFLRGLETTATYDPETEEFVLNSPTLSSVKWWPGSLGKTANHAVVLAQLYTQGKCYGIHPFMAQIRSMEDHQPLPGITVGEIGPKMGMRATDNGFLKLDNIRIPRDNMLMKNAQVTRDGTYVKPRSDKLNYGTMVFVRVLVIDFLSFNLARACTIAIRYSAIRRQSEITQGEKEVQILDYQAQQHKLLPALALAHALKSSFFYLMSTYKNATQAAEKGDLATLPELHAMSSGIKALSTDLGSHAIETCRLACGGHGYLLISGLPRLYATSVAACTYEGENTVLYLQTARYLMKVVKGQTPVSKTNAAMSYLLENRPALPPSFNPNNLEHLVTLYKVVAHRSVHIAASEVDRTIASGKSADWAWNLNQVELMKCAKAHILYFVAVRYCDWVSQVEASSGVKTVLSRLCHLFLTYFITENSGNFLKAGVSEAGLRSIHDTMVRLLTELRPDAVPLVDAYDFHDLVLNSALGCYDGNVYERMFEWAQKTPLNKTQVHESYFKYLKPMMQAKL